MASRDTFQLIMDLALMTSACDGDIRADEIDVVAEWMEQRNVPDSIFLELKTSALSAVTNAGINVKSVCDQLESAASVSLKYDIMELCLRIAQVDGIGAGNEMRFLMSIGKWLSLDHDKFREMRDKILPSSLHETVDVDTLLGLHAGMTKEEKLKHLTREYRRWNQLTGHKDSEKREQANEMLEIIAQKRNEVQGE